MPEQPPPPPRNAFADIAPALGTYTTDVLFGDVWERPGLSKRDRSLITVAHWSPCIESTRCRFTSNARSRTA